MDSDSNYKPDDTGLGDEESTGKKMIDEAENTAEDTWLKAKQGTENVTQDVEHGWQKAKHEAGQKMEQVRERIDSDSP